MTLADLKKERHETVMQSYYSQGEEKERHLKRYSEIIAEINELEKMIDQIPIDILKIFVGVANDTK